MPYRFRIIGPCAQCGKEFGSRQQKPRYCSISCSWKATKGREYNAKISRASLKKRADKLRGKGTKGYVKRMGRHEHRSVAEQKLRRPLRANEIVHHIDGDKHNNDPANLEVMTQSEHAREHFKGKKLSHCRRGHPFTPENTSYRKDDGSRFCKLCARISHHNAYLRRRT